MLDAGSTLNHPHVLIRLRPRVEELHIVTLAPEPQSFPFLDVSYLYADLRELPMRDGTYDRVVSISTLEHVGMDNAQYGDASPRSPTPPRDLAAAMGELRRVLQARRHAVRDRALRRARRPRLAARLRRGRAATSSSRASGRPSRAARVLPLQRDGLAALDRRGGRGRRLPRPLLRRRTPASDRAVAARAVACVELRR